VAWWEDTPGFLYTPTGRERLNGRRVRGPMSSPWAKTVTVDHPTRSQDAYLKLIEDLFLSGQRLDPKTDERPDRRPTVREEVRIPGDLVEKSDLTQEPLPPVVLPAKPSSPPGTPGPTKT